MAKGVPFEDAARHFASTDLKKRWRDAELQCARMGIVVSKPYLYILELMIMTSENDDDPKLRALKEYHGCVKEADLSLRWRISKSELVATGLLAGVRQLIAAEMFTPVAEKVTSSYTEWRSLLMPAPADPNRLQGGGTEFWAVEVSENQGRQAPIDQTESGHRRPPDPHIWSEALLAQWYIRRVSTWPSGERHPNLELDLTDARLVKGLEHVSRDAVRAARGQYAPGNWRQPGAPPKIERK